MSLYANEKMLAGNADESYPGYPGALNTGYANADTD